MHVTSRSRIPLLPTDLPLPLPFPLPVLHTPNFNMLKSYSFIPGNLCEILFFLQMLVDGETCGDTHSTNYELLVHYHAHTAWPWFYIVCYIANSFVMSGMCDAFRLMMSPNTEAVTRPRRCTTHSPDWSSP